MISLYFGLPGCGKTTHAARMAYKAIRAGETVYTNIDSLNVSGVIHICNDDIGVYDISNGLLIIDEASLLADNRDFKRRDDAYKHLIGWMLLHRHYKVRIAMYVQQWDAIDKRIRVITDRVYYVYRGKLFGRWLTRWYRVPYGIIIPKQDDSGPHLGDIVQGYCRPRLLGRLFGGYMFQPRWYRYYDSWDAPLLPALPENR